MFARWRGSAFYIALLASGLLLLGCAAKDPESLLREGQALREQRDYKGAIIHFKNALQANPQMADARLALGLTYLDTGDALSAEKELRKAKAAGIRAVDVALGLARAQIMLGQPQKALDELNAAAPTTADQRAQVETLRGDANLALGKPEVARRHYASAQQAVANFPPALGGIAKTHLVEQDFAAANAAIVHALARAPQSAELWVLKGDIARSQNDNRSARESYEKALGIDPQHLVAQANLISTEIVLGDLKSAQTRIDQLRKRYPESPMVFYHQGLLEFRAGQYPQAMNSAARALRVLPEHVPSMVLLGATQFLTGSYAQANKSFIRVLDKQPRHAYARKLLIASLLKLNDPKRALDAARAGLELSPEDPQLLALAGSAYSGLGDSAKAADFLKAAVARDPKSADLRTDLGLTLLATGDDVAGIAELRHATRLEKGTGRAAITLMATQLRQRQFDQVLATANELRRNGTNDAQIANLEGLAYLGKNDLARARERFAEALRLNPTFIDAAANLAQLDLRSNNPAAARKHFEQILAQEQNNVPAMLALARMEGQAKNFSAATQWLERARAVKPPAVEPRLLLARYYIETREPKKALVFANEAKSIAPTNPEVLDVLGSAQLAAGDPAAAALSFAAMVNENPSSALAHFRLGSAYLTQRRWNEAISSLNRARALKPNDFDIESTLAAAHLHAGNPDKALEIARSLREKRPGLAAAYLLEGNIYLSQRKSAEAIQAYQKAFDLNPSGLAATSLFRARLLAGQNAAAFAGLQDWVAKHPKDALSRMTLADAHYATHNFRAAAATYEEVLRNHPNSVLALNNLAASYLELNDARALATAERAQRLAPDNPGVLDTYGWALLKAGQAKQAAKVLQKAVNNAPASPEIRYHYSVALLQSGDKTRARRELEALIGSGKPFPQLREAQDLLQRI